jgi:TolB-like protein
MAVRNSIHDTGAATFGMAPGQVFLRLVGPLTLVTADGTDITPKGKRAKAILALLALSPAGVRSRRWVQDKLWSERGQENGAASLRQEISAMRRAFKAAGVHILLGDRDTLRLDRNLVHLDTDDSSTLAQGEDLLEGLDIRDPEFEDWLRTERMRYAAPEGLPAPAPRPRPGIVAAPGIAAGIPANGSGRRPTLGPTMGMAMGTAATTTALIDALPGEAHKPYLVVRGFHPIGSGERERVFAEGLTAELQVVLGSLSGAFVVHAQDGERDPRRSYELSGEVRNQDRLRITARLTALDTGQYLWTRRFDYDGDKPFYAQEEISRKVIEAAQIELVEGEWARIWTDEPTSIDAWELYQKGRVLESEARKDSVRRAILTYREALAVDPRYTPAMISLGFCLVDQLRLGWIADRAAALSEARALCSKVMQRKPQDYFGRALIAFTECASGNHQRACDVMAEVVRDAPESPELLAYYGVLLGYCGHMHEEIRYHKHALSLTKHPPNWIQTNLAFAHVCQDDPQAPQYVEAALAADPQSVRAHLCRVVVAVRGGDFAGARIWASRLLTLEPEFSAERWSAEECFRDPGVFRRIANDLRTAGL